MFMFKFAVYIIIIYSILNPLENYFVEVVTYHSYLLFKAFTVVSHSEDWIHLNGLNIEVINACTGMIFISIFLALVFSLSKNIKEVLIGIPLILIIYFGNLLRILLTGILGLVFINNNVYLIHEIVGYLMAPLTSVIASLIYLKILSKMRDS
ncbi:MAG TPA: archaeosortase family protein ArtE [Methanothermococcus okinawensis]|uniref:Archaeosortase family protein ArtE n=1 Tax=Methanothermococcus okinawensis TaxID=155863 RepID=A0A832YRU7_9EURY|nr:archaeosortase family protein ArtE [Methanothermococcus okinawensis]